MARFEGAIAMKETTVRNFLVFLAATIYLGAFAEASEEAARRPIEFSGVYPHLAYFNNEGECGTGAVVPWAGRLWTITYGPHLPQGSSDKLYEISDDLTVVERPESIGGTPANRMIHRESNQLFIGPYAIDAQRNVRVIPYAAMPGRHTATMRHLTNPAGKVYFATMEEGLYEVDVASLAVNELYPDANRDKNGVGGKLLPGYHGKGAYSGQGRVVYANNGEYSPDARKRPEIASGCLAEWNGKDWSVVRRNQFCDVTGPGGICGNADPEKDPIWAIGWDYRSLILMLLDGGTWHAFRLPKAAHTYDGAHGWNTEWPRIRDIGQQDLLMTMHGMFWRFPRTFSIANTAGIRPRSTYLKVIGDFANWNSQIVFGCDDAAKSEFLNKRKAKGELDGPGQSQSNLWFAKPEILDHLLPSIGRGAVWMDESINAGTWSDAFLFAGFERRGAHLATGETSPVTFEFQVDANGNGRWQDLRKVTVNGYAWVDFPEHEKGEWLRVRTDRDCAKATAQFMYSNADRRQPAADALFDGLARTSDAIALTGLVRARGEDKRTLQLAASKLERNTSSDVGYYELDASMTLTRVDDSKSHDWLKQHAAIPRGIVSVDAASVVYIDDAGRRWRLPRGEAAFDELSGQGLLRIDREVVTERDLFNCHGTMYELPAENAGGFARIRPITTHNRKISDYCSYRGLLVMTGLIPGNENGGVNRHIIRSSDGCAAVWVGVVDDLWRLGKSVGHGGPWKDSTVKADAPSDPYLMTGYDRKRLTISHNGNRSVIFRIEADITGTGQWMLYQTFDVRAGAKLEHDFPVGFAAYWIRAVAEQDCTATVWLDYE